MDFPIIDRVFGMEGGNVLDFSNRTFAEFFCEVLGIDIDDSRWSVEGESNAQIDAGVLRAFNAKVEDKAKWSRGLIISQSDFSADGLHTFGKGKSVVCMDGLDLHEVLTKGLDLAEVISLKVRRAAETGLAHVPIRDLKFATRD